MSPLEIIEITLAVIFGIAFVAMPYDRYDKAKSKWPKICLLSSITLLTIDALSYIFTDPKYPFSLRYLTCILSYICGDVAIIISIRFRELYIRERTILNPWLYRIPALLMVVVIMLIIFEFSYGHIIEYEDGIEVAAHGMPLYITVLQVLILLYLPFVVFSKRKDLGMQTFLLLWLFDFVPIASIVLTALIGMDLSLVIGSVVLYFVISLLLKKQFLEHVEGEAAHRIMVQNTSGIFALEDNFESLYDVELDSGKYTYYVRGDFYKNNIIDKLVKPADYFKDLRNNIDAVIYPEDKEGLYNILTREAIRRELKGSDHFDYYYRLITQEGPTWFKVRIVYKDAKKKHVIIGAFNASEEVAIREKDEQLSSELLRRIAGDDGAFIINCEKDTRTTLHDRVFAQNYKDETGYSILINNYINTNVMEADRAKMLEMTSTSYMLERIKNEKEFSVRYRKLIAGIQRYYEVRIIRYSENEVLQSFRNIDAQVSEELSQKVISDDYFAIYLADLDSDLIKVVKRSFVYRNDSNLAENRYSESISRYIDGLSAKGRHQWEGLDSREGVRKFLANQDKREIVYESAYRKNMLTRVTWYVIDRINGEANTVCLAFADLDEEQADHERLNEKIAMQKVRLEKEQRRNDALHDIIHSGKWTFYVDKDDNIIAADVADAAKVIKNDFEPDGYSWLELVHPDDKETALAAFKATIADHSCNTPYDVTYRMISRNGVYRWFHSAGRIVRDESGNGEFFGVHINITNQINGQLEQKTQLEEALTFTNFFLDTYVSAYYVNLDNYTCQIYKRTEKLENDYPIVTNYYDSIVKYINRDVHPSDREGLMALVEPERMKQLLHEKREFTYVFRDISGEVEKTYRMQVIRGAEEHHAAFGFIDISEEIHEQNNRLREAEESSKLIAGVVQSYNVAFAVNMATDSYKLLRNDTKILQDASQFKNFTEARASFLEFVHKFDRERIRHTLDYATIRARLKETTSFSEEYRLVFDGTTTWHELNITAIDTDRIAIGFAEKDLEITKRHLEEKRYAEYFALFVVDIETRQIKTIMNHERFGAAPAGQSHPYTSSIQRFAAELSDEPRDFFMKISSLDYIKQELAHDDKRTFSYKSTHLDGDTWIDVTTYVILRNEDGTPAMFTLGFSIVDALATIRQELQIRLKTDMQMIGGLASGYDTLYYINIDENIFKVYNLNSEKLPDVKLLVNKSNDFFNALRAYGSSEMVYPDDRPLFAEFTAEIFRERLAHCKRFELRFRHQQQDEYEWVVMEVVKYEDVDEKANAIAVGFINRDAEIRKEQEQQRQLQESHDAAEAANQSKTNFLFNMSHDIRTPMNAITGFTNMAVKHIDNKEKVLDCLSKIQKSGSMLLTLINSILEVSRIEAGKATLEEQHGDIYYSFTNIETTLHELADTKDIKLTFEFGEVKDKYVYCDFSRCMRIFVNVISNAIKYTPEGGRVTVRCEQIGEAKDNYGTYRYTIADNGIGMSEEFQAHVFEQFSRERTTTVSGIQGTGLGMAVCKSFVDLMGGTIECKSKQGVGTTFIITLPFRLQEGEKFTDPVTGEVIAANTVVVEAAKEINFTGKRILLVEDNELNREIALEILSDEGLLVEEAEDGSLALEMLRKRGSDYYDFILMDIQMPVMNGYEATKEIRRLYPETRIPIIALSANAFAEDKAAALTAGMDDHVAKPIKIKELFTVLGKFL